MFRRSALSLCWRPTWRSWAVPAAGMATQDLSQGERVLSYWKDLLLDNQLAREVPLRDAEVKELLGAAIRLRQGRAQSTLPEELVAVFIEYYKRLDAPGRARLFQNLTQHFGVDAAGVQASIVAWQQVAGGSSSSGSSSSGGSSGSTGSSGPGEQGAAAEAIARATQRLATAAQPLYSRLFVPISQQPCGIKFLVDLRADVLECVQRQPGGSAPLRALSDSIRQSLAEWFSVGLLQLRRLTWEGTSAALLEKVMAGEAVHRMEGWEDLKQRLGPCRRVFAFMHQAMPDEPLVVLHTALVRGPPPSAMAQILSGEGACEDGPTTAVFYSISSTQKGLAGVDLGNFLIKQVAHRLLGEFPSLATLCTLSPMPGFSAWLSMRIARGQQGLDPAPLLLPQELSQLLPIAQAHLGPAACGEPGSQQQAAAVLQWCLLDDHWLHNRQLCSLLEPVLLWLGALYLVEEKRRGLALDPVANFHLRNGAQLWRLNWRADASAAGLARSHGLMVNYVYQVDQVAANNRAYLVDGRVVVGPQVEQLLRGPSTP